MLDDFGFDDFGDLDAEPDRPPLHERMAGQAPPLGSAPAASSSASLEMPAFFSEPPPNSTALDPRPSNSAELQALLDEKLALQQRMEELEMKLRS